MGDDAGRQDERAAPAHLRSRLRWPRPARVSGRLLGRNQRVGELACDERTQIVDALAHLGVREVDLPCTPARVWRAITEAAAGPAARPDPGGSR